MFFITVVNCICIAASCSSGYGCIIIASCFCRDSWVDFAFCSTMHYLLLYTIIGRCFFVHDVGKLGR